GSITTCRTIREFLPATHGSFLRPEMKISGRRGSYIDFCFRPGKENHNEPKISSRRYYRPQRGLRTTIGRIAGPVASSAANCTCSQKANSSQAQITSARG